MSAAATSRSGLQVGALLATGVALVGALASIRLGPFQLDALSAGPWAAVLCTRLAAPKTGEGQAAGGLRTVIFGLGAGLALCALHPVWALAGLALALGAQAEAGSSRGALAGLALCLGAAVFVGGWTLSPLADASAAAVRVVYQLRGAGAVVGAVAVTAALLQPWRAHRPEAAAWTLVALAAVGRSLGVATPETLRLAAPGLLWAAAVLALLGAVRGLRGAAGLGPLAAAVALTGLASTTTAGAGAAALALTLGLLNAGGRTARLATLAGLALAAAVASWAALTVALPGLRLPALVVAATLVLAVLGGVPKLLRTSASSAPFGPVPAAVACLLAILGALGVLPVAEAAEAWASRASGLSLPVDDVGGHRRLWLRETSHAPPAAQDAGVP